MSARRFHITGASGSGTTTLGRALADHLAIPHFDTDDFYWLPAEPAYSTKREPADRLRLMHELFVPRSSWVLSGSLMSWGDELIRYFDLVAFLTIPGKDRLARLKAREVIRFGEAAIAQSGARHQAHIEFLDWASRYDDPVFDGRSRHGHEAWLARLDCAVGSVQNLSHI